MPETITTTTPADSPETGVRLPAPEPKKSGPLDDFKNRLN